MQQSATVRRHVQRKTGATSDRFEIEVHQLVRGLYAIVFLFVPEPAGADRNIALGRDPAWRIARAGVGLGRSNIARRSRPAMLAYWSERLPTGLACDAFFISDPADVRPDVAEDHGVRLQRPNEVPGFGPAIISRLIDDALVTSAAVIAVTAVRAVVPDLEDRTVAGEQFAKLLAIHVDILRLAVLGAAAIPGRDIDAELELGPRRCSGQIANDIAFSTAPGAGSNRMVRGAGGPQTKSIVMFRGEDDAGHAAVGQRRYDAIRVKSGGIENRRLVIAVAPLLVCKCVDGEMQECVRLHLVPMELSSRGESAVRRRRPWRRLRQRSSERSGDELSTSIHGSSSLPARD